ncbi:MAG TPA: peptidoglycan-associated lipoprotein Pal [bacterium]|nr:peptidoglycan-associated lipoprotein Pal [bacterium]HPJ71789.1 peptidoglycan-associated lipoprotein Pal [bacterium]HPQ65636.1 peptidoglycan-associated lipoprotein Pal [bacterium]
MERIVKTSLIPVLAVLMAAGCASNRPEPTATPDQISQAELGYDFPLEPFEGDVAFIEPSEEDALVLQDIHFAYDSSDITPEGRAVLSGVADWMLAHPNARLLVEGHCDERGTNEYNTALGERRALNVRLELTKLGINPDRIHSISYGEDKPVCAESTEECWAKNRRAHFLVDYGSGEAPASVAAPEPKDMEEVEVEMEEVEVYQEPVPVPSEEPAAASEDDSAPRRRVIGRYHY